MLHGRVGLAAVHVDGEEEIVGNNIGCHSGLGDEAVEGEEISVPGLAKLSGHDSIAGVYGGFTVGVDGVAGVERRFFEIILADEL